MMNEESRGRPVCGWSSQTMVGSTIPDRQCRAEEQGTEM